MLQSYCMVQCCSQTCYCTVWHACPTVHLPPLPSSYCHPAGPVCHRPPGRLYRPRSRPWCVVWGVVPHPAPAKTAKSKQRQTASNSSKLGRTKQTNPSQTYLAPQTNQPCPSQIKCIYGTLVDSHCHATTTTRALEVGRK